MTITAAETPVGASNGTSAKAPFDRWFRYPAGLSRAALDYLFQDQRIASAKCLVDPFCGAATVGTSALAAGKRFVGIEAHPAIAELALLKVGRTVAGEAVREEGARMVRELPHRAVTVESEHELVRRSFDDDVLRCLAGLKHQIQESQSEASTYLKWALLATLRDVARVKVGWPYMRPNQPRIPLHTDAAKRFLTRAEWIAEDLDGDESTPEAFIATGDSGDPRTWNNLPRQELAGCLSSPPYLNNFDYADATRLEMYFWGRNSSWREMVDDIRHDMLIASTQQSSVARAQDSLDALSNLPKTRSSVVRVMEDLRVERCKRTRGKEYDQVLPSYVRGLSLVLERLRENLQPGAWCGWVVGDSAPYGVYIDTPDLIMSLANELGFGVGDPIVMRNRGLKWRTNGSRHQVALNERVIWFRSPEKTV